MSNRILLNKLSFLFHVANLPRNSLGHEIYLEQRKNGLGLVAECQEFLDKWNLNELESYNKYHFKKTLKARIYEKQRNELLEMMKGMKKIDYDTCVNEKFEMKDYFKTLSVHESRLRFKIQNFLTPTVKLNFKNETKFRAMKWLCEDCMTEELPESEPPGLADSDTDRVTVLDSDGTSHHFRGYQDSQHHLMHQCTANEDLRRGKTLTSDKDLVQFFKELIEKRQNKLS